jgi:hypothetical protein
MLAAAVGTSSRPGADPHCLGQSAVTIGTTLVDTVFGTN